MSDLIALDRRWRREVRSVDYRRRSNFASDREYNDYLEEVEDLVEQLVDESTRPAARTKLDNLRGVYAAETLANRMAHDEERRQREDAIDQERYDQQQAALERREAEERAAQAAAKAKRDLQQGITAGTTTVENARANLAARTAANVESLAADASANADAEKERREDSSRPAGYAAYRPAEGAPSAAQEALAQPIDAQAAAAKPQAAFMLPSVKAEAEAYEADPALVSKVRLAGGYDRELWRVRYRQEALSSQGMHYVYP